MNQHLSLPPSLSLSFENITVPLTPVTKKHTGKDRGPFNPYHAPIIKHKQKADGHSISIIVRNEMEGHQPETLVLDLTWSEDWI